MELQENFTKSLSEPLFQVIRRVVSELEVEAYVIGGFVRDQLLGRRQKKDIDIVAVGSGIELAQAVQKKLKGARPVQIFKTYGTAMIHWKGIDIEFVGARKESYAAHSRNPEVAPGSLEDDQNRRDFTINALAVSLNESDFGILLDPFDGLTDLKDKILKTPLDPEVTYSDDPLRMLRAIRFATQLDFKIEEVSLNAITENAARIEIITKERVVEELTKILDSDKPSKGFILLEKNRTF